MEKKFIIIGKTFELDKMSVESETISIEEAFDNGFDNLKEYEEYRKNDCADTFEQHGLSSMILSPEEAYDVIIRLLPHLESHMLLDIQTEIFSKLNNSF